MGRDYLDSSEFLFQAEVFKPGFELLFVHAIEILLKAFILLKDLRNEAQLLREFKNSNTYGHDYSKLLNHALDLDTDRMLSERLCEFIRFHSQYFYHDSIEVRYIDGYVERSFDKDSFSIVRTDLIQPLQNAFMVQRSQLRDDPL